MTAADPTALSVAEAAAAFRARQLSPTELTRAYLERIERLNPLLNAYLTVTADLALQQAAAAAAELAPARDRGPLPGLPLAPIDRLPTGASRATLARILDSLGRKFPNIEARDWNEQLTADALVKEAKALIGNVQTKDAAAK